MTIDVKRSTKFDKHVADRLRSSDLAVAYRAAWGGSAHVHCINGHLKISRSGSFEGYPYALSFEDLMAEDWTVA